MNTIRYSSKNITLTISSQLMHKLIKNGIVNTNTGTFIIINRSDSKNQQHKVGSNFKYLE